MNERLSLRADDRGVSELVGFVVVFGIIISSVGLLYMTGFQAMGDYQETEQTKNAERAMDALAENFNDIVRNDGVKYRAGEMSLRQGTISYADNETYVTIPTESINASGSFIYEYEGTEVVYEGGAVIRSTENADWTIRNPPIRCSGDAAIISLVDIRSSGTTVTAHGNKEVTAVQETTETAQVSGDVTIEVHSDRDGAWNRTLSQTGWSQTGNEFECDTDGAVIRTTTITIEYN